MFRAFLPDVCPSCGEDVPRAAALRCPLCRTSFLQPPPAPSPARPQGGGADDEG